MAAKYSILKALEFDKLSAATKKQYGSAQGLVDAGWWVQKKYDGVFGMLAVDRVNDVTLFRTRTGELIASCAHIEDEILRVVPKGHCVTFLGEIWHPTLPFPAISGGVRRHQPSPHLSFVINDVLPVGLVTDLPYHGRYMTAVSRLQQAGNPARLLLAETYMGRFPVPIEAQAREWAAQGGYDGAILRDPAACYTIGNASLGQIVKVKPTLSLSLRVTSLMETAGEKTQRPVYTVGVEYSGVRTVVGAGMPHTRAMCPEQGSIIEVECLGITADGKLREPRFKGIRHDVLEAGA